ncbi:ATP-binding protein [Aneurinibacillus thermoaerophilus]|uniref:histidine kinase n=1 Tax=Aneurinibacillus thermoaerophilus TaxID=143495 RepID=A0ABX8YDK7_ANETH|nr:MULTISPECIES: ATP-binding protein [Aneurinibacillus]AMA73724.1 hypothetical protein ACH33_13215 [Aneurinibacillus sp. XH2]QYY43707.1 HAMP domain-containing protein [Aneurinibacillus thermoaerophilus]
MGLFQKWNNLSIHLKFFSVFLVIVLFAGCSMLLLNNQLLHVVRDNDKIINQSVPNLTTQLQVKSTIMQRINYVMLYITTGNEEFHEKFEEASEQARKIENQLKQMALPHEREAMEQFIIHSENWENILRDRVIPVYQRNNAKDAMETLNSQAHPIAIKLMNEVEKLSQQKVLEINHDNQKMLDDAWLSVKIGYAIASVTLLLALLFSFYMSRSMTNPILALLSGVRKMTNGNFSARVPAETKDEWGELGKAFNRMSISIANLVEELRATNLRLQEESRRAQESTRLKSEFLANMSHELRTPLTGIIGFAELLHEETEGKLLPSQKSFTQNIIKAGEHLLTMINDILDLSKIEAGKYELDLSSFDIVELVKNTLTMLQSKVKKRGILLQVETSCPSLNIEADELRIRQVLLNLLSNAIKFSPDHSTVRVKIERTSQTVTVHVIDQGIGIEEGKIDKIFEQFYQNDGRLERKYEGTGLGLTLSRQLVELHGGTIDVESEPGKGSVFSFHLPYRSAQKADCGKREATAEAEPLLILYPEDFLPFFPCFYKRIQESSLSFLPFMVESKQRAVEVVQRYPGKNALVVAVSFHPAYVELLEAIREHTDKKIFTYIKHPPRLVERGQIMRVADAILSSPEDILSAR